MQWNKVLVWIVEHVYRNLGFLLLADELLLLSSSSLRLIFSLSFHIHFVCRRSFPSFFYTFSLFGWNACMRACQSVSLEAQSSPVPGADTQVVDPVTAPLPHRGPKLSDPPVPTFALYSLNVTLIWAFPVRASPRVCVYCFCCAFSLVSMLLLHRVCSLARSPCVIDCSRIIRYRVIFNRPHLRLMLPNPN